MGLSPLDDGRHRHHRFLLFHHLARLLARSTFTRHRGPIYFADCFIFHALPHIHPRGTSHPRVLCSLPPLLFFFRSFKRNSRRVLAVSSRAKVLPFPPCPSHSFSRIPPLELKTPSLLVSIWYMVAHCTSLVRS